MDKFRILWNETDVGQLILEKENLYTWFHVQCHLPEKGLWCAWVIGEQGELRLGILEPEGERFVIRRRYSERLTSPLGNILNGEIRPAFCHEERWEAILEPYKQIHNPWLRQQLCEIRGVLVCMEAEMLLVAVPYDRRSSFPLVSLFCFADIRTIRKQNYAVFAFDKTNCPVFL